MNWRVVIERDTESGEFSAWCPELPGCATAGVTEAEAISNIKEAIELYLEPDPIELSSNAVLREVAV
ncbi:MAG: type II toxin-antitoxin system HicB family antitoxin [Candidatus Hydrogenedentes bacterium]|nr:type II toxin-antitoxin system HicB family antitoxin [Candidatus Hydrogenedentota bacterium]